MPARALYHGVQITVIGNRITARADPQLEAWLQRMVDEEMLPPGYFVSTEMKIVAMLEAIGATIVEPPRLTSSTPGRIY